jgi:hypothetical protein
VNKVAGFQRVFTKGVYLCHSCLFYAAWLRGTALRLNWLKVVAPVLVYLMSFRPLFYSGVVLEHVV